MKRKPMSTARVAVRGKPGTAWSSVALNSAVRTFFRKTALRPRLGLVLGSGFQPVMERVTVAAEFPLTAIPGMPRPTVGGHAGRLVAGRLGGTPVWVVAGRVHYYEGHDLEVVTRPIRFLAALGVKDLLLTNAAGGIRRTMRGGDFMILRDHINAMGVNPLRGGLTPGLERFVDLTCAYDRRLSACLRRASRGTGARVHAGVYLAVAGPSYETPAEIRAFGRWGADAVGMSTVPEVIVARQMGLAVAGLSAITNLAAGRGNSLLSHADVLATGRRMGQVSADWLERFARMYAAND